MPEILARAGAPAAVQTCYVIYDQEIIEFRRVEYDVEKAAQAIEATEMPREFAAMLRMGTG